MLWTLREATSRFDRFMQGQDYDVRGFEAPSLPFPLPPEFFVEPATAERLGSLLTRISESVISGHGDSRIAESHRRLELYRNRVQGSIQALSIDDAMKAYSICLSAAVRDKTARQTLVDDVELAVARLQPQYHGLVIKYGELLAAAGRSIAPRDRDEKTAGQIPLLYHAMLMLSTCPPGILPRSTVELCIGIFSKCSAYDELILQAYFPIVHDAPLLWSIFECTTIDDIVRLGHEISTPDLRRIVGGDAPDGTAAAVSLAVATSVAEAWSLFASQAPFLDNLLATKTLLDFTVPFARVSAREGILSTYLVQVEDLTKRLLPLVGYGLRDLVKLQTAMQGVWPVETRLGFGNCYSVFADIQAGRLDPRISTAALRSVYGDDSQAFLDRLGYSPVRQSFLNAAMALDLHPAAGASGIWYPRGYLSFKMRFEGEEDLWRDILAPSDDEGRSSARSEPGGSESAPAIGRVRKGPQVNGKYNTDGVRQGYRQFRALITDWQPFEEFIASVANAALKLPPESAENYGINVARLSKEDVRRPKENLGTQIKKKFETMVGYLIARRIILATADETSDRGMLAQVFGYVRPEREDDRADMKKFHAYLIRCGLIDRDYQHPYGSEDNRRIEGELEWLEKYRKNPDKVAM